MTLNKLSKILAILLLPFIAAGLFYIYKDKTPSTVRAFGVLTVDFGVPDNTPLFDVSGILPGDCVEREVKVTNSGSSPALISVKSSKENDNDNLSEVMDLSITEENNSLYSKTLKEFFLESDNPNGVELSNLGVGEETHYKFTVCFKETADNDYQGDKVKFDLTFGQILPDLVLPEECAHLTGIISKKIEGTAGNDKIRGTREPELIYGFGGNDNLDGNGGDDCIVAGDGKDTVDGGQGKDTIVGGGGDDKIDGGQGEDLIYGNDGDDNIKGGSGDDTLHGNASKDSLDGGSGDDIIYGEEGKDDIKGGSGNDNIYAGEGDDKVKGDAGNDTLDGQENYDILNGSTGADKCINGESISSCEII